MRIWNDRPPEIAHLFNPAFCALLIREGVLGFGEVSPGGMPYPLVFLLLPIVLHKATRESLPGKITTKMHPWIQEHQEARVGFSERCATVAAYTREAILFAANGALLTFSPEGALQAPQLRLKRPPWPTDSEFWACRQRARFVGRWLASAGDNATIFAMWGVSSMTMQIRSIILYNRAGAIREVSLKPGAVNIVTGRSLTGKSAIIDIVDYCMGRSTFNIPEGVIRDSVAWYAVVFRFGDNTEVLVAKPAPKENAASQSQVYYEVGTSLTAPPLSRLIPNSNDEAVVKELSKRVGIVPNLHMPPAGQSRNELEATIRHTVYYLFQTQGLIASKELLFHRQLEPQIPQTIKLEPSRHPRIRQVCGAWFLESPSGQVWP
jgi:hypothetical protein